jgi:hypothetical protein
VRLAPIKIGGKVAENGDPESGSEPKKASTGTESSDSERRKLYPEDTDNRGLWDAKSKYDPKYVLAQNFEAGYMLVVLLLAVLGLILVAANVTDRALLWLGLNDEAVVLARRYEWLSLGGLLGGIVYSSKWLYHAIAKGMWHEDRKVWRYLSPWISLGTTIGIGALFIAGFMKTPGDGSTTGAPSASSYIGLGFLIGYFSDMFLAKMKDVTQVLFGETESHFKKSRKEQDPGP